MTTVFATVLTLGTAPVLCATFLRVASPPRRGAMARPGRIPQSACRGWTVGSSNFYFLLAGLLIFLGIEPFVDRGANSGAPIQLAFTAILVIGVLSLAARRVVFRAGVVLAVVAAVTATGYWWTGAIWLRVVDLVAITLFLVLAIGVGLRAVVLEPGAVTLNRIVGALCVYLLLGVLWTVLYAFVELVEPTAFAYASDVAGDPVEQFLYYSFVTLTTLGYGDVTPVHPVARTLAYLEAVIGQLYVAVLVASLVGRYSATLGDATRD